MELIVPIPDEIATYMQMAGGDLPRRALEALGLEEYNSGRISTAQLIGYIDILLHPAPLAKGSRPRLNWQSR